MPQKVFTERAEPRPETSRFLHLINAPRALVCNVHSKTDHLEHWWGCKRDVVSLAFRAGGIYHYAMR